MRRPPRRRRGPVRWRRGGGRSWHYQRFVVGRFLSVMHEGLLPSLGERAGRRAEHAEEQHQGDGDYQAQHQAGDEYLPEQAVLKLQVHEEGDDAEELDDRQDDQRGDDDAAAAQVLGQDDDEFDERYDGQENRQQAVLLEAAVDALRHVAEEEPPNPGVLVGCVVRGIRARGGPLRPPARGCCSSGGCLLET